MEQRIRDVVASIRAIKHFIAGMSQQDFMVDRKTQSAVERELMIISEACSKIRASQDRASGTVEQRMESRYPDWHLVSGMGNRLRHEYGRVDLDTIWNTVSVTSDLDDLERALTEELQRLE